MNCGENCVPSARRSTSLTRSMTTSWPSSLKYPASPERSGARGGAAQAGDAEEILQRQEEEDPAQPIEESPARGRRIPLEAQGRELVPDRHPALVQEALEAAGVHDLHLHHGGEVLPE